MALFVFTSFRHRQGNTAAAWTFAGCLLGLARKVLYISVDNPSLAKAVAAQGIELSQTRLDARIGLRGNDLVFCACNGENLRDEDGVFQMIREGRRAGAQIVVDGEFKDWQFEELAAAADATLFCCRPDFDDKSPVVDYLDRVKSYDLKFPTENYHLLFCNLEGKGRGVAPELGNLRHSVAGFFEHNERVAGAIVDGRFPQDVLHDGSAGDRDWLANANALADRILTLAGAGDRLLSLIPHIYELDIAIGRNDWDRVKHLVPADLDHPFPD